MSFEFAAIIKITIVLAGAGLATQLLKRASASTRHAVWTIAMVCALLLPLADALLPAPARMDLPVLPVKESQAMIVRNFITGTAASTSSPTLLALPAAKTSRPLSQWIAIAWALGFLLSLGRVIAASFSARRLVQRSLPLSGLLWNPLLKELRSELSITQKVDLRDGGATPPLTWGLFRHFILLPSTADSWTVEQQRAVLAHELAHAKRYDGLIQLLVQIVCSIYWFNPVVWLAARRMRLERERACDDYALHLGAEAGAYADHLLDLASAGHWNSAIATVSIAHPSQLETRLRSILNPETKRGRLSRWTAAILLSSLTAVTLSVAAIHFTELLSLSLPTSFAAMAATLLPRPVTVPEPQQTTTNNSGTVAGRILWADGAPSVGATVSAIATSTEGLPPSWVMGTRVVASAVTDNNGRYRIENLTAGLYHIVTGPVYLPRTFSDVSASDGTHLVAVTAGNTAVDMDFTCVRYSEGVINARNRMLTVTGKLVMSSFGGRAEPNVIVNNNDGSVSHWVFRDSLANRAIYWWPGYDAGPGGPIDTMVKAGETVTITGMDTGSGYTGRWQGLHILAVREVTRGGLPQSR